MEHVKLTASDGVGSSQLGMSVDLSGNRALVGASLDTVDDKIFAGSAYVWEWDGSQWTEQGKLTASDGEASDFFGTSVAIQGSTALVGAFADDVEGLTDAGSAYMWLWDGETWVEQIKLTPNDAQAFDKFGASVALSGNQALVGAYGSEVEGNSGAGAAYIYGWDGNQWVEQAKINATDPGTDDFFGWSVDLRRDSALIGAYSDDVDALSKAGSAYIFLWDGSQWVEGTKLTATDGAKEDRFGVSVSLGHNTALVGAWLDDVEDNTNAGSAYVYRWEP